MEAIYAAEHSVEDSAIEPARRYDGRTLLMLLRVSVAGAIMAY